MLLYQLISRLKDARLNPTNSGASRYDISIEISQEELNLATMVKSNDIYIATFGVIPKRDYPDSSEEREIINPAVQALKEIFKRYPRDI